MAMKTRRITAEYLQSLLNSTYKTNPMTENSSEPMSRDFKKKIEREIEDEHVNDSTYENVHAMNVMQDMYQHLTILETKVLKLKGVIL